MTDSYLWETFLNLGKEAFARKDFDQAEESFSAAVHAAEVFGPVDPRLALSLNNLATTLQAKGRLDEALPLLQKTLGITSENLGENHPEVGIILKNLAMVCQGLGRGEEAERYLTESIELARREPDGDELCESLESLANFYREQRRFDQAIALFREVVTTRMRHHGLEDPQAAAALLELAHTQLMKQDLEGATNSIERGLAIYHKHLGTDDPQMAEVYLQLGSRLQSAGLAPEAEVYQRKGKDIFVETLGADHPKVADALENLAGTMAASGHLRQATVHLEQALQIRRAAYSDDDIRVAGAMKNLAGLHLASSRIKPAEELYQRSLDIFERMLGPLHPAVLATLEEMVQLYHHNGNPGRALQLSEKILSGTRNRYGESHPNTAQVLASTALMAYLAKQHERSLELSEKALEVWERQSPPPTAAIANCWFNIGTNLEALERKEEAIKAYQTAQIGAPQALQPRLEARFRQLLPDQPGSRSDRRRFERTLSGLDRTIEAELRRGSKPEWEPLELFLVDLSEEGIRVNVEYEFPSQKAFWLRLPLKDVSGETLILEFRCQTVWRRDLVGGSRVYGLALLDPPTEVAEAFRDLSGRFGKELRRHQRVERALPVSVNTPAGVRELFAADISIGGLGLSLSLPLPSETELVLRLHLEFGMPVVEVRGKVVWTSPRGEHTRQGVRFFDIDPVARQTLQRYIDLCIDESGRDI